MTEPRPRTKPTTRWRLLPSSRLTAPAVKAKPSADAGWSPLWALARFDIAAAIRGPAFIVLLGIGFVNSLASLWYADEFYGNTIHPVTRVMIEALQGAFTIIPLIIAIYYAGELVWRDRERRMHEIIDSTSAPDWAFVVPKILAISIVLFSTLRASVLAAVVVQALKGNFNFELSASTSCGTWCRRRSTWCCTRYSRSSCRRWSRTRPSAGC